MMMADTDILKPLVAILEQDWEIYNPEQIHTSEELARVVLRRWRSFERRNKVRHPEMEHRIIDLAKGICTYIEEDWHHSLTLASEYRMLAAALAAVLEPAASSDLPHSVTRR